MFLFIYVSIFILGLVIGSFLNCLIWRLHTEETMMNRSHCPKCQKQIAWYDNIPVFSYIVLLGKCRHCRKNISIQYPVVELVVGLLFVLVFIVEYFDNFQSSIFNDIIPEFLNLDLFFYITILKDWFVVSVMTIVFIYDLRWYLILDKIMIPAMIVVFGLNIYLGYLDGDVFSNLWNMLISAIIGGGFFLFQFVISRGKWIGGGDIRLGFLMGLILGWQGLLVALLLAYISGAIIGVGLIVIGKKKMSSQIPFGVFLSTATLISLFWGQDIIYWYLNLL
jgi:prepilin signal peptidase PulO-like enzyme (type II secretory pathway)